MTRAQLEHIIGAAAAISDDTEIVVFGSQAILGSIPDAPADLLFSNEAGVFPKNHPERWELIDGAMGELSAFHDTFGYYAQGIEVGTALLPVAWATRLVPVCTAATRGATGYCLELHDLLAAKYLANREKDRRYGKVAFQHRLADAQTVLDRVDPVTANAARKDAARAAILSDSGLVS
jgi:hypothetical protein